MHFVSRMMRIAVLVFLSFFISACTEGDSDEHISYAELGETHTSIGPSKVGEVIIGTPIKVTPIVNVPTKVTPTVNVPVKMIPTVNVPVKVIPTVNVPVKVIPTVNVPVKVTPIAKKPIIEIPLVEASIEEGLLEGAPIEAAPIEAAPLEVAPIEEAPIEAAPIVKLPAISVEWFDNSDNEDGFYVERKVDDGTAFRIVKLLARNTTVYIDSENIIIGDIYCYKITAFNQAGTVSSEEMCSEIAY